MIVVAGIDQGGASPRVAVTVGRSERFRRIGEFDRANAPSSLAPSGHDGWLAGG
jgi:hypothetical protein